MSERDTHFRGWAKRVQQELDMVLQKQVGFIYSGVTLYNGDEIHRLLEQVLARRAYDLVSHTILNIDPYHLDALPSEEIPARIPDMTEWPVEPK